MLRHSRDITRFNRQRYIQKRKNCWWVRNSIWKNPLKDGYLDNFDIRPKSTKIYPHEPYNRDEIKRETVRVLKDFSMR